MSQAISDSLFCAVCEKSFESSEDRREHGWTHLHFVRVEKEFKQKKLDGAGSEELVFNCDLCDFTAQVLSEMLKHIDCQSHLHKVDLWKVMTTAKNKGAESQTDQSTKSGRSGFGSWNNRTDTSCPPPNFGRWGQPQFEYYDRPPHQPLLENPTGMPPNYQIPPYRPHHPGHLMYNPHSWNWPRQGNWNPSSDWNQSGGGWGSAGNWKPYPYPPPQIPLPKTFPINPESSNYTMPAPRPTKSPSSPNYPNDGKSKKKGKKGKKKSPEVNHTSDTKKKESIFSKALPPKFPNNSTTMHGQPISIPAKYKWVKPPGSSSKDNPSHSKSSKGDRKASPSSDQRKPGSSKGRTDESSRTDDHRGKDTVSRSAGTSSTTYEAPTPISSKNLQQRFTVMSSIRGKHYEKLTSSEKKNRVDERRKKKMEERKNEWRKKQAEIEKSRKVKAPTAAEVHEADSTTSAGSSQEDGGSKKSKSQASCSTKTVPETKETRKKNWEKQIKKSKTQENSIEAAWKKRQESYHLHASPYVASKEGEKEKEDAGAPEIAIIPDQEKPKEPKNIHVESRVNANNFIKAKLKPDAPPIKVKREIPPHFQSTFTSISTDSNPKPNQVPSAQAASTHAPMVPNVMDIVRTVENAYQATVSEKVVKKEPNSIQAQQKDGNNAPPNSKVSQAPKPVEPVKNPVSVKQEIIDLDMESETDTQPIQAPNPEKQMAPRINVVEQSLTQPENMEQETAPNRELEIIARRQAEIQGESQPTPAERVATPQRASDTVITRPETSSPLTSRQPIAPAEFSFAFARSEAEALRTQSRSGDQETEPSETRRSPRKRKTADRFSPEKEMERHTQHLRALWEVCQAEERLEEELKSKDKEIVSLQEQLTIKRQEQCQRFMALEAVRMKRKSILENQSRNQINQGPIHDSTMPSSSSELSPSNSVLPNFASVASDSTNSGELSNSQMQYLGGMSSNAMPSALPYAQLIQMRFSGSGNKESH